MGEGFNKMTGNFEAGEKMPVLFLGHGSPMNAIEDNEFTRVWRSIGQTLPKPSAILCISAHWETRGTHVTAMERPETIHDFGGFPARLFEVEYPAPGNPDLATETKRIVTSTEVGLDQEWGLDHGCWSVVSRLYPEATIPVIQMSLDYNKNPAQHFELAAELSPLRKKGVLIIGSGNMVHNLSLVNWHKINEPGFGYDWALEASEAMKRYILEGDFDKLINFRKQGKSFNLAIPTPDHFLPLLYALSLKEENESLEIFNDKAVMGSLTMTSLKIKSPIHI